MNNNDEKCGIPSLLSILDFLKLPEFNLVKLELEKNSLQDINDFLNLNAQTESQTDLSIPVSDNYTQTQTDKESSTEEQSKDHSTKNSSSKDSSTEYSSSKEQSTEDKSS